MSSRKTFLFYLFNDQQRPLYVDDSGHVVEGDAGFITKADGQPAHLSYDPEGWKQTLVKYGRNIRYHGLFRTFSTNLKFIGDGYAILRELLHRYGVEAVCHLGIGKLDRTQLPYNYRAWFTSEINFAKYEESDTDFGVEVLEGGLYKLFKAYENTEVEIPLEADAQTLEHDGLFLEETNLFSIFPSKMQLGHLLSASLISTEGQATGFAGYQVQAANVAGNMDRNTDPRYLFAFAHDIQNVRMRGKVSFTLTGVTQPPAYMRVHLVSNKGKDIRLVDLTKPAVNTVHSFDIDLTFNAVGGENFFLIGDCGDFSSGTKATVEYAETDFTIYFKSRWRTTYIRGYYPAQLLEKIVRKITNGRYGAKSAWLSSRRDLLFCSGDAVRGFEGAKIKVSLSKFYKILGFWSVGLGIEGDQLVVEPLAYFYRPGVVVRLGEVTGAKLTPAEDLSFNTIRAGYEKQELDDVNGRYGFAQPQQWKTPATRMVEELDLLSPAMADPYAIEHLRTSTEGQDTTANSGDNQVVIFHVAPPAAFYAPVEIAHSTSGVFTFNGFTFPDHSLQSKFIPGVGFTISGTALNDGTYTTEALVNNAGKLVVLVRETVRDESVAMATFQSAKHTLYRNPAMTVTGVPDPVNIYNVELSPKRAILNNGALIRSVLDKMDGGKITLSAAERNSELATTVGGVTIKENEDIQIGSLPGQLFLPHYITFTTEVPITALELLKANPYGEVEFTWKGRTWRGFLCDGGIQPGDNSVQQWKLISSPQNNLALFNA